MEVRNLPVRAFFFKDKRKNRIFLYRISIELIFRGFVNRCPGKASISGYMNVDIANINRVIGNMICEKSF